MILKMTNKDEDFYKYMGKFFGSRIVEKQTNDRIYDDPYKTWYIYIYDERPVAFVSIERNAIKNIYTIKEKYLEELLNEIKRKKKISSSIVTNLYLDLYEKLGFEFLDRESYKNFVVIYTSKMKEDEEENQENDEKNSEKDDTEEEGKKDELAEQNNRLAMI